MQKEVKGKKKPVTTSSTKKTKTKFKIKKRIPEKKTSVNNKKNSEPKIIKKRVIQKHKPTKQDIRMRLISLGVLLVAIAVVYVVLGIEFAAIAAVGSTLIIGLGLLIRKGKTSAKRRKIINALVILCLTLGILAVIAFAAFFMYIKSIADPQFTQKEKDIKTAESTILYDKDGQIFKKLGTEQRTNVKYNDLPDVLVDAIIATEDSRFFQHNGFDLPRFVKAAIGQVMGNSDAGGASTLTMQVAKNTFSRDEDGDIARGMNLEGLARKFTDIYIAIFKLENKYSKEEIIEFYVNNHFLGGNIYGVAEASEAYFGKPVSELNLSEAAIIAGMFKSPNYYRPTVNPDNASQRRNTVLNLMVRHGYITSEERAIAASIPVETLTATSTQSTDIYQGYIDTVVAEVQDKYKVNPYKTSLKVYTNLDRSKQNGVNAVFNGESYRWVDDYVQCGVAVVDSQTGAILAIGNGRNINGRTSTSELIQNYATDIERQPGSTAKPIFDYGPGIEYNNWSTYTLFTDGPYTYSNGRSIKNWDNGYFGTITLRTALYTSRNIPALKAFQQVDNKKIIEFATNLGIEPEISGGKIHEAHSIGAFTGVSPLDMAAAYAAFSNGGYYNEPFSVNKIIFRSTGEEMERTDENYVIHRKAMSEATAYMIADILQDTVLNGGGTPKNVAVKTGTTNFDAEYMKKKGLPGDAIRDSWAVGFTTKTVMAMWYGYDYADPQHCLRNLPSSIEKDKLYKQLIYSGAFEANREPFKRPSSVVEIGVAVGSDPPKLATAATQNVVYELFKKDYVPTEYDEAPLATPSNFTGKYNALTKRVTLSWDAVAASPNAKDSYGKLGYNVYKNGVLLDWTDKTYYSFETTSPYDTYKVIATYKSYSGIQSDPAKFKLEEKVEKPDDDDENDDNKEDNSSDSGTTTPTTPTNPTTPTTP